jgi:hypothetical protein
MLDSLTNLKRKTHRTRPRQNAVGLANGTCPKDMVRRVAGREVAMIAK